MAAPPRMSEHSKLIRFAPRTGLTFGIFPGGAVDGLGLATGKPDVADEINRALDLLQGNKHFLVRAYLRYSGTAQDVSFSRLPPVSDLARYTWNGRKLDLVLSNWDPRGNLQGWVEFVESAICRYGPYLRCLQICEEPNLYDYPGDGRYPYVVDAIATGLAAAREKLRQLRLSVAVGFNAVPCFDPNDGFWRHMARRIDSHFINSLDYVGLNLYPDVTEPLVGEMPRAVTGALIQFRDVNLAQVGIPASVPIHVSENGWPTGPFRYYTRQAAALEEIIRIVHELHSKLNITHYQFFCLRDADTANPDPHYQFGILRDDYSPKPAFETYRRLIAELGG